MKQNDTIWFFPSGESFVSSRYLLLSALVAAALLSGCAAPGTVPAPAPAPVAAAPAPQAQCNADGAKFAIGQPASAQLETASRVHAGAESVRILKPNQVVTLEFNGGRLNLVVDARNRVTAVRCG